MQHHTPIDFALVKDGFARLRGEHPKLRTRDAAARLGVSEAELLAAHLGDGVALLGASWGEIIIDLPALGDVLALTRNQTAVIECTGSYENVDVDTGLVLGERIDLRLFLDRWRFGFAVEDSAEHGFRRSLQFFDATGTAVHKIFSTDDTDTARMAALMHRCRSSSQAWQATMEHATPARSPGTTTDAVGLRAGWAAMEDTHDVFALLRRFAVDRLSALELIGEPFACRVGSESLQTALTEAAGMRLPVMIFVGNPGTVQIHSGALENIRPSGDWINVLDSGFNLHVLTSGIASSWVVQRPTRDGTVTSLDLFDAAGTLILQLFGKRKPGQREIKQWRDLATALDRSGAGRQPLTSIGR